MESLVKLCILSTIEIQLTKSIFGMLSIWISLFDLLMKRRKSEFVPSTMENVCPDYQWIIERRSRPIIKVFYGPYICNGILKHRVEKLHGLKEKLLKLKYTVQLIPTSLINRLTIEIIGYQVCRINIKNLKFYMRREDDPRCQLLTDDIEEAVTRLHRRENVPQHRYDKNDCESDTNIIVT